MLSPREFQLLMESEGKRRQDEYNKHATFTMWSRAAYHAKKLKQKDLYDPKEMDAKEDAESFEEKQQRLEEQQTFLDSIQLEGKESK